MLLQCFWTLTEAVMSSCAERSLMHLQSNQSRHMAHLS